MTRIRGRRRGLPAWALAAIAAGAIHAQPAAAPARPTFTIPRTSEPIRVDGIADEAAWRSALALDLPYETDPGENTPSAVATRCLLTYDSERIYVACRADDPAPKEIRARYSDRDTVFQDDFLGVKLDTFNDERRAFQFFVNPLGVQMDILEDDVNNSEDSAWDTLWDSAGRITASGYEVEIAIPFSSLRFQRGDGDQTWGLDLVRWRPRDRPVRMALAAKLRGVSCDICQMAKVTGFSGAEPGRNLEIVPTLTATRTSSIESFPDGGLTRSDSTFDPGLTVRWGFTPNLTLGAALNPDFSQVEADSAQLAVNEQFALFYPEKRPLFLEGADFFATPITAFYSRTIADPSWGLKLSGKEGHGALGALVARDEITNLLFPSSEESELGSIDENCLSAVLRYRHDIGRFSSVGALATARDGQDYSNLVAGVDADVRPTPVDSIDLQALHSQTEYPAAIRTDFGQPEGKLRDHALVVSYRHQPRDWLARASYSDFGRDFRADLGFVPQVDVRRASAGGGYRWYGDSNRAFSRILVEGGWEQSDDQTGALIARTLEGSVEVNAGRDSFVFLGAGHRTKVFNEVPFDQGFASASFEINVTGDVRVELDASYGDREDTSYQPSPGVARQGKQLDVAPGVRWNAGRHLRVTLTHSYRSLDLDAGRLFRANLSELRLVYQFNLRAFLRLITQYSDIVYDPDLSEQPPRSRELFSQLLFSYKLDPQTALFVGYTGGQADNFDGITAAHLVPTSRALFVKLGYAWVP